MSDGQNKGDDGVAARCVGQCVGDGVGAFGVGHAVNPGEAIASVDGFGGVGGLVDGKVESDDAVTLGNDRSQRVGEDRVGGGRKMEVEAVEGVAGADIAINVNMDDRSNIQAHGQHTVGTGGRSNCNGVLSRTMPMKIVPEYRQVVFADGGVNGVADIAVDIEDERDGGVTAEDIGGVLDIGACCIVVDAVKCVRQVILVDGVVDGGVGGLVDGEMEYGDGVAVGDLGGDGVDKGGVVSCNNIEI